MKPSIIQKFVSLLLCIAVITVPTIASAQEPGGGADVPIDGGLSILLAAGVGYGVKKIRDERKKKSSDS